jgi:RNA polymerase sigma-70 factor, ECF subfamily
MVRVRRGEEAAFRLLVERWERQVFAFLWRMTGNEDDARELTQDVFVKVHANASKYEPRGLFKSWLFRIAGNLSRSFARRRKLVDWISFDSFRHDRQQDVPGPDAGLEAEETRDMVRAAVDALPERQRQALVLKRFHEMSQREIASAMEISEGAVESLLVRAMTALRGRLTREMEETA